MANPANLILFHCAHAQTTAYSQLPPPFFLFSSVKQPLSLRRGVHISFKNHHGLGTALQATPHWHSCCANATSSKIRFKLVTNSIQLCLFPTWLDLHHELSHQVHYLLASCCICAGHVNKKKNLIIRAESLLWTHSSDALLAVHCAGHEEAPATALLAPFRLTRHSSKDAKYPCIMQTKTCWRGSPS